MTEIKTFLSTDDLIETLSDVAGYSFCLDELAINLYAIYLDHKNDATTFLDGKILIDDAPYNQNIHGDLRNLNKRLLRNPEAFEFENSFVDILWNRG